MTNDFSKLINFTQDSPSAGYAHSKHLFVYIKIFVKYNKYVVA